MAKQKKSKSPNYAVDMAEVHFTLKGMDEKLDALNSIVLGNGVPERGMVVTMARMEQKQDAFLAHMEDKTIHRTSWQAFKNMSKVSLVLVPAILGAIFFVNFSMLILFPERSQALEVLQAWFANLLGLGG